MNPKSLESSSGARTRPLQVLIGPALAAHVLLFLLLAAQKPSARAAGPCARTEAQAEVEAAFTESTRGLTEEYRQSAGISAGFGISMVLGITAGPAVAGRTFYNLVPRSRSSQHMSAPRSRQLRCASSEGCSINPRRRRA